MRIGLRHFAPPFSTSRCRMISRSTHDLSVSVIVVLEIDVNSGNVIVPTSNNHALTGHLIWTTLPPQSPSNQGFSLPLVSLYASPSYRPPLPEQSLPLLYPRQMLPKQFFTPFISLRLLSAVVVSTSTRAEQPVRAIRKSVIGALRIGVVVQEGIKERATLFGGHTPIETTPGTGTRVVVELPLILEDQLGERGCRAVAKAR